VLRALIQLEDAVSPRNKHRRKRLLGGMAMKVSSLCLWFVLVAILGGMLRRNQSGFADQTHFDAE